MSETFAKMGISVPIVYTTVLTTYQVTFFRIVRRQSVSFN